MTLYPDFSKRVSNNYHKKSRSDSMWVPSNGETCDTITDACFKANIDYIYAFLMWIINLTFMLNFMLAAANLASEYDDKAI